MPYIFCPSCNTDFHANTDEGDFVCSDCGKYFNIGNEHDCFILSDDVKEADDSDIEPNLDLSFYSWARDEADWILENTAYQLEEPAKCEGFGQGGFASSKKASYCIKHGEVEFEVGLNGKKICKICANEHIVGSFRFADNYSSAKSASSGKISQEASNQPVILDSAVKNTWKFMGGESLKSKIIIPLGVILLIILRPDIMKLFPIIFIPLLFWSLYSILIAFLIIAEGVGGIRWPSRHLFNFFCLVAAIVLLIRLFDGGGGRYIFDECIVVGRYGEEKCY